MKTPYTPRPMDTSGVRLPEELMRLAELLARNTHDVWARQRMNEGWTYGALRDSEAKTHPDLVPYEELPESEKEYDRSTSQETLKVILSMGFKVTRE